MNLSYVHVYINPYAWASSDQNISLVACTEGRRHIRAGNIGQTFSDAQSVCKRKPAETPRV